MANDAFISNKKLHRTITLILFDCPNWQIENKLYLKPLKNNKLIK